MQDLDKLVKSLYLRLYRKGFNIPNNAIKAEVLAVSPEGILTDEQKDQIIEKFMSVTEAGVDDGKAALPNDDDIVSNYESQSVNDSSSLAPTTSPASALSASQAREIVFEQCEALNIELKSSEIKSIAGEIQAQLLDVNAAINYTITVLKQFISSQERQYTSNLTEGMQELMQHTNTTFRRIESTTKTTFDELGRGLKEASSQTKSFTVNYTTDLQEYFSDKIA